MVRSFVANPAPTFVDSLQRALAGAVIVNFFQDYIQTTAATNAASKAATAALAAGSGSGGDGSARVDRELSRTESWRNRARSIFQRKASTEEHDSTSAISAHSRRLSATSGFVSLEDAADASEARREFRREAVARLRGPTVVVTEEAHCILTPHENHAAMFRVLQIVADRTRTPCPSPIAGLRGMSTVQGKAETAAQASAADAQGESADALAQRTRRQKNMLGFLQHVQEVSYSRYTTPTRHLPHPGWSHAISRHHIPPHSVWTCRPRDCGMCGTQSLV